MTVHFRRHPIGRYKTPETSVGTWMLWWQEPPTGDLGEQRRRLLIKRCEDGYWVEPAHFLAPIFQVTL